LILFYSQNIRENVIIMIDPYDAIVLQSFANTIQISFILFIGIIVKQILFQ